LQMDAIRISRMSRGNPMGGVLDSRISLMTCSRETSWLVESAGTVD